VNAIIVTRNNSGNDSDQSIAQIMKVIPGTSETVNKGKYRMMNSIEEICSTIGNDFIKSRH
jgi:hypothetical protein